MQYVGTAGLLCVYVCFSFFNFLYIFCYFVFIYRVIGE